MEYSKDILLECIKKVRELHNKIIDLYNNTLYEDNWDKSTENTFNDLIDEYSESLKVLELLVPQIPWKSQDYKKQWLQIYNDIIKADEKSFRLVKIRHDAYMTYRGFRSVLISRLNRVMGWATSNDDEKIFEWFNENCAKVPLNDYRDQYGNVLYKGESSLSQWIRPLLGSLTYDINKELHIKPAYDQEDVLDIFKYYVKARQGVFDIFNMLTSTSEVNGYDKWHNFLDAYVTNDTRVVNDKNLKTMYTNTKVDTSFVPKDDYQLVMDDKTWAAKGLQESYNGLNESWFDEEIMLYNLQIRDRRKAEHAILNINMVPKNANACRVTTDGNHVYASTKFYPGDIIEIAPSKNIDKTSLYSKDVRDIAFEVVPNEEWVIPFGYCQYYDLANKTEQPNCDFVWDPIKRVIVIKAINKINKNEKLVLNNVN